MPDTTAPAFRRILVPLDGSALAEEALPIAGSLAHATGAAIHLVSVLPPVISTAAQFGIQDRDASPFVGTGDHVEAYLTLMTAKLVRSRGIRPVTAMLVGEPADRLAEYVEDNRIALVVMTTHGRGGLNRFWLGSVADQLVRRLKTPVLLLRHGARSADAVFERITVALDGSENAEEALDEAIALGSVGGTPVYSLVRVVEPPAPVVTPVGLYPAYTDEQSLEHLEETAGTYLESSAERLRARGLAVETEILIGGAAERIVRFAERIRSDLIVVGTRAAWGVDRLLLGSVADKVVRSALQPVLVVPAGSARAAPAGQAVSAATEVGGHTDELG
jgi:nucleotide-binding universal stress UspA family protein